MALTLVSVKWEKAEQVARAPQPRQGHAVAVVDDVVYVYGGCRAVDEPAKGIFYFRDLHRLHVKDKLKWEKVNQTGKIPTGRQDHALCSVGCKLFLFGGKNELKAKLSLPGVYVLDTRYVEWTLCEIKGTQPLALNAGIATLYQDIYVIGGIENHQANNDVNVFSTETLTWRKLSATGVPPSPRCDLKCVAIGRIIYVFGGTSGEQHWYNDTYSLDTRESTDTNSLKWERIETKGTPPSPRGCFTFTGHSNKDIYVFGGVNDEGLDKLSLGDFHKLSLVKMKWKQPFFSGPVPSGRFGHAAFVFKNTLYIFGGSNEDDDFNDLTMGRLVNPSHRKPLKVSSADLQGYLKGSSPSSSTALTPER